MAQANSASERPEMTVYRMFQSSPFGPEEIGRLVAAYDETLKALRLKNRDDAITKLVAKRIIAISQTGVRDPVRLAQLAIKDLSTR